MRMDWVKPAKKTKKNKSVKQTKGERRNQLHLAHTISSRRKKRMSEEIYDFLCGEENDEKEKEEEIQERREKKESLTFLVESTRKMFLLQYSLEVKVGEKNRLETTLKEEETKVKREEKDLKLAEAAFDCFLQENDRKSMEAQKKAETEAKVTGQKDEEIKTVEAEILQLKSDIYNLKDVFRKFSMYGKFLATISPEDWRNEQEYIAEKSRTSVDSAIQAVLKLDPTEPLEGGNDLYFQEPSELLDLFSKLETENLTLIQECQHAEARLAAGRSVSVKTRAELNQQAENLEAEIRQLEKRIKAEKEEAGKVEEIIENSVSGESRRGGEDKMLDDLEKSVLKIYESCVGENEAKISTIDMLHHIEMRMENLTQELEVLNPEKVELARVTCEVERRQREKEARMEKQRLMEAQRNKAALDRALAPPFRPVGRRPVFRSPPKKKDKMKN